MYFGFYTFAYKMGTSISLVASGYVLHLVGFDPNLEAQTASTQYNLAMVPAYLLLVVSPIALFFATRYSITRESYAEFPDLWASDFQISDPIRLTDANPQIADFAWGEAELVEWVSLDGIPLQGVLIKPGNYQPGKRYPVLIDYYQKRSYRFIEYVDWDVTNYRSVILSKSL